VTPKARLAAVPDKEDAAGVHRIELSGALRGSWVEVSDEASGEDALTMFELMEADMDDAKVALAMYPKVLRMLGRRAVNHNLKPKGSILQQKVDVLNEVMKAWLQADEDAALPPAQGER
jgi:hypothetical protein